jgi:hypothetical protein
MGKKPGLALAVVVVIGLQATGCRNPNSVSPPRQPYGPPGSPTSMSSGLNNPSQLSRPGTGSSLGQSANGVSPAAFPGAGQPGGLGGNASGLGTNQGAGNSFGSSPGSSTGLNGASPSPGFSGSGQLPTNPSTFQGGNTLQGNKLGQTSFPSQRNDPFSSSPDPVPAPAPAPSANSQGGLSGNFGATSLSNPPRSSTLSTHTTDYPPQPLDASAFDDPPGVTSPARPAQRFPGQ